MSVRSRLALAFGGAAVSISSALLFAAPAAHASGQYCHDNGNWTTCVTVDGHSNFIDLVSAFSGADDAFNGAYDLPFHVQLIGPSGNTLCNSPTETDLGNSAESCLWQPEAWEPPGNYCLITWVYNGEYHNAGEACLYVFR